MFPSPGLKQSSVEQEDINAVLTLRKLLSEGFYCYWAAKNINGARWGVSDARRFSLFLKVGIRHINSRTASNLELSIIRSTLPR